MNFVNLRKIAQVISIILGIHVWLPILITVSVMKAGLSRQDALISLIVILFLEVGVPLSLLQIAVAKKLITGWDFPKREERHRAYFLYILMTALTIGLLTKIGSIFLVQMMSLILVICIITTLITFFWKISLHMILNTAGCIFINVFTGWQLWWIFTTVPVVFWARLYLKRHSHAQLIAGTLLGAVVTIGSLKYFSML